MSKDGRINLNGWNREGFPVSKSQLFEALILTAFDQDLNRLTTHQEFASCH